MIGMNASAPRPRSAAAGLGLAGIVTVTLGASKIVGTLVPTISLNFSHLDGGSVSSLAPALAEHLVCTSSLGDNTQTGRS
jgi:hypothetical protein